jgi:2-polyprenyl-3-methyl-5-hydroxy-6-metoxy-1,4-benzoquinol methylase
MSLLYDKYIIEKKCDINFQSNIAYTRNKSINITDYITKYINNNKMCKLKCNNGHRLIHDLSQLNIPHFKHKNINDTEVLSITKSNLSNNNNNKNSDGLIKSHTKNKIRYIKSKPTINKNGFWQGLEAKSQHVYDNLLSNSLLKFFKNEKVMRVADFGCGMGDYIKHLNTNGIKADGYDGNPNTPNLTDGQGSVLDLSKPITFRKKYDWVYSFEVGEHIPQKYEGNFINNLHNNNKYGIVLSWAIVGQSGHGHINCKNNDYIKNKVMALGYTNDIDAENIMRRDSKLDWFKNTIMVFRKIL